MHECEQLTMHVLRAIPDKRLHVGVTCCGAPVDPLIFHPMETMGFPPLHMPVDGCLEKTAGYVLAIGVARKFDGERVGGHET